MSTVRVCWISAAAVRDWLERLVGSTQLLDHLVAELSLGLEHCEHDAVEAISLASELPQLLENALSPDGFAKRLADFLKDQRDRTSVIRRDAQLHSSPDGVQTCGRYAYSHGRSVTASDEASERRAQGARSGAAEGSPDQPQGLA